MESTLTRAGLFAEVISQCCSSKFLIYLPPAENIHGGINAMQVPFSVLKSRSLYNCLLQARERGPCHQNFYSKKKPKTFQSHAYNLNVFSPTAPNILPPTMSSNKAKQVPFYMHASMAVCIYFRLGEMLDQIRFLIPFLSSTTQISSPLQVLFLHCGTKVAVE